MWKRQVKRAIIWAKVDSIPQGLDGPWNSSQNPTGKLLILSPPQGLLKIPWPINCLGFEFGSFSQLYFKLISGREIHKTKVLWFSFYLPFTHLFIKPIRPSSKIINFLPSLDNGQTWIYSLVCDLLDMRFKTTILFCGTQNKTFLKNKSALIYSLKTN